MPLTPKTVLLRARACIRIENSALAATARGLGKEFVATAQAVDSVSAAGRPIKGRFIRTQTGWAFENIGFDKMIERGTKKPIALGEKVDVVNNMQLQLNTDGRILLIRIP